MSNKIRNIAGQKFNRLTAIKLVGFTERKNHAIWLFACDCGTQKELVAADVVKGSTKSCGCLRYEMFCRQKHGGTGTRLYGIWHGMRDRCRNPNCKDYKNYGGRGIKICDEWGEFASFRAWALNNGYKDTLTIDRINNDGNYEPLNARWTIPKIQNINRRNTLWYEINGIKKPLIEWCRILNVKHTTAFERTRRGKLPFLSSEIPPDIINHIEI
ncbi:MAG: hypothetical protein PHT30_04625 [Bacilli bacterium]|nr:hypothetical protein [Bacilli bacterium]